jgi:hypothetical protein
MRVVCPKPDPGVPPLPVREDDLTKLLPGASCAVRRAVTRRDTDPPCTLFSSRHDHPRLDEQEAASGKASKVAEAAWELKPATDVRLNLAGRGGQPLQGSGPAGQEGQKGGKGSQGPQASVSTTTHAPPSRIIPVDSLGLLAAAVARDLT